MRVQLVTVNGLPVKAFNNYADAAQWKKNHPNIVSVSGGFVLVYPTVDHRIQACRMRTLTEVLFFNRTFAGLDRLPQRVRGVMKSLMQQDLEQRSQLAQRALKLF